LYELVSLASPYEATSLPQLLGSIVSGERRPWARGAGAPSSSLVAVIERAMALAASDRYASVDALREDIEQIMDGHTPSAEQASLARRAARLYFSRDRGLSRLRVVDVELLMTSALLAGAAIVGLWMAASTWPTLLACTAVLLGTPPTLRWLRERGAKD
jgi:hypothetical protein